MSAIIRLLAYLAVCLVGYVVVSHFYPLFVQGVFLKVQHALASVQQEASVQPAAAILRHLHTL